MLDTARFAITGANPWRFKDERGDAKDAFQREHNDFFAAIRTDADYNEAGRSAIRAITAIMGRMASYSGKMVEWDDAMNSKLELMPKVVSWESGPPILPGPDGFYPIAIPGRTVGL